MNFATDYTTAYGLLRQGGCVREQVHDDTRDRGRLLLRLPDTRGVGRVYNIIRRGSLGRVQAAIYAFKMVKEMKRQKVLMSTLFDVKAKEDTRTIVKHPINIFPMTLNRTIVQMRDPDQEKKS